MPENVGKADIIHLFGEVSDHTVAEILATDADINDLEAVAMLLAEENDVMGDLRKPLAAAEARVYDIVMRDELYAEDPERGRRS